jgi:hypothetical protein
MIARQTRRVLNEAREDPGFFALTLEISGHLYYDQIREAVANRCKYGNWHDLLKSAIRPRADVLFERAEELRVMCEAFCTTEPDPETYHAEYIQQQATALADMAGAYEDAARLLMAQEAGANG